MLGSDKALAAPAPVRNTEQAKGPRLERCCLHLQLPVSSLSSGVTLSQKEEKKTIASIVLVMITDSCTRNLAPPQSWG